MLMPVVQLYPFQRQRRVPMKILALLFFMNWAAAQNSQPSEVVVVLTFELGSRVWQDIRWSSKDTIRSSDIPVVMADNELCILELDDESTMNELSSIVIPTPRYCTTHHHLCCTRPKSRLPPPTADSDSIANMPTSLDLAFLRCRFRAE
jgi:hypothetical protein